MTNSKSSVTMALYSIIAVLLVLVIWLFLDRQHLKTELQGQLSEVSQAKAELEIEYNEAVASLEAMRSDNDSLNTVIDGQMAELATQKSRISKLIASDKDLKSARAEIANLRIQGQEYVQQINELQAQNQALAQSNQALSQEKEVLTASLTEAQNEKSTLEQEKTQLKQEFNEIEKQNLDLDAKVYKASVIQVEDVDLSGVKLTRNQKERVRKNSKYVDRLDVCFDIVPNQIASHDRETFFLRVIDPNGTTMYNETLGSGSILNQEDNTDIRYSISGSYNYDGNSKELCMQWMPETGFDKGEYKVEIFNKGYKCGSGSITFR